MIAVIGVLGALGVAACFIWMIVSAIKRNPVKRPAISLAACFVIFVACMTIDGGENETRALAGIDALPETSAPQVTKTPMTEQPAIASTEPVATAPPEPTPEPIQPTTAPVTPAPTERPTSSAATRSGDEYGFNTYNNPAQQNTEDTYVLNTNSMKIHTPGCPAVLKIAVGNYATTSLTIEELEAQGYTKCGMKDEPWN